MNRNKQNLIDIIRENSALLSPLDSGAGPRLKKLDRIKAVFFDVYGTLFVSGCGEIGTAMASGRADALCSAIKRSGISAKDPVAASEKGIKLFFKDIKSRHEHDQKKGNEFPEIDIYLIWEKVLATLRKEGYIDSAWKEEDVRRMALEYECRVNPVWPMPGAAEAIYKLAASSKALGIVSNAQFFTPLLFDALMGKSPAQMGFDERLCIWSWRLGTAKPSKLPYMKASEALKGHYGIVPGEALYIGNDMLNDIVPAAEAGFKTALFAGDKRSLRLRRQDPRCRQARADIVLTSMDQLPFYTIKQEKL